MRPTEKFWFWRELVFINIARATTYAVILLVADTVLLAVDITRLFVVGTVTTRPFQLLFASHGVLAVLLIIFLILFHAMRPGTSQSVTTGHSVLALAFAIVMIGMATVVTMIDQGIHGQITIYVVGCMALSVAIYLPPRTTVPIFVFNHAVFVVSMVLIQDDTEMLLSHLVNGSIVMLLAVVITKLMFDSQRRVYQGLSVVQNQQARLERMAIEDSLTGLYNRRYADARLREEFERSRRYHHPFSVAMADIDRFKRVNDEYSHQVGDEVLRHLSGLLRAEIRAVDVVARYGGEEFVIIFPETDVGTASDVCEKIRMTVMHHRWDTIADRLAVTISIGVAGNAAAGAIDEIIQSADERLYAAKHAGRNKVIAWH